MNFRRVVLQLGFVLSIFNFSLLFAQLPVLKVDLNNGGRGESEVNEPGYIPWSMNGNLSEIKTEGVTFALKNGNVDVSWFKAGVQSPNYARLANDGITSSNIELHISGLQNGKHSLVTFHNTFSNPENNLFSPMDIYVNNKLQVDDLMPPNRVLANDAAATAYLNFEVTNNETVIIRFQVDQITGASDQIPICGFHLNSADPSRLAKFQYPEDNDEHVDIDSDELRLYWLAPKNTATQDVYFGKSKEAVIEADNSSPVFIGNITDTFFVKSDFYNMEDYYWRVDPINNEGDTTKGDVWYFKKRQKAFPEAEGYGQYAIGGRGGKVVYVTNLNADGSGSFKDAVENHTGPRTILFAVSGLITLNDRLVINHDYITVAGQSAPGKGVCFRWAPLGVTGDNLIVQNLRVRLGIGKTFDGMGLTGAQYSIIDHCSISWTLDEAFSSRGAKNITLQRTLISEALNAAGHSNYPAGTQHGYAASIGGDVGSFHHNLLAHCEGRNWSLAGGLDGENYYAGRLDIFNNLVYNWGNRATDGGAHEVNFVNNYYKKGKASTQNTILKAQLEGTGKGSQSYFYSGNILENTNGTLACDGKDNSCSNTYVLSNGQILDWDVFVNEPFFPSQATIQTAGDAYKKVLSDVGCVSPFFDWHDTRIINETIEGTYSIKGSKTGKAGLPDSEKDIGGWEPYFGFTRDMNWDTDLDGLPNWWEKEHGLDTNSTKGTFEESNEDPDKNGYTRLEEYLQWMDNPHYLIKKDSILDIDLYSYARGFTKNPTYSISNIENGNADISDNNSIVTFTPKENGLASFDFTVTDADGSTLTRKIGLYIGGFAKDVAFDYSYKVSRIASTMKIVTFIGYDNKEPVNVSNTDINSEILVFPNPAQKYINVQFVTLKNTMVNISISDISGRIFKSTEKLLLSGKNMVNFDISELNSSIYFIHISGNEVNKTLRIIKK